MNLRVVGTPTDHGLINLRVVDLDSDDPMSADDRVLGPDGKPLGWQDGRPSSYYPDLDGFDLHGDPEARYSL